MIDAVSSESKQTHLQTKIKKSKEKKEDRFFFLTARIVTKLPAAVVQTGDQKSETMMIPCLYDLKTSTY